MTRSRSACMPPVWNASEVRPCLVVKASLSGSYSLTAPQHFLYFLPLPQGQGSLRPIFGSLRT